MTFEEIQRRAHAVVAAAFRGDRPGMIALVTDLDPPDARALAVITAELHVATMREIAAKVGVTDAEIVANMEDYLLELAAEEAG